MTFTAYKAVRHSARNLFSKVVDLGNVISVSFHPFDKDDIFQKLLISREGAAGQRPLLAGFYLPAPLNYCTLCAKQ